MFRTEAVDHIDDEEAGQEYDELKDKDVDNDGDQMHQINTYIKDKVKWLK